MVTICQKCGARGFSVALIYCDKCQVYAVHRYCLDILPATFEEYVIWFCMDCEPKAVIPSTLDNLISLLAKKSDSEKLDIVQETQSRLRLKKNSSKSLKKKTKKKSEKKRKGITSSLAKSKVHTHESSPALPLLEVHLSENRETDQKLGKESRLDGDSFNDEAKSVAIRTSVAAISERSHIPKKSCYVEAQPIIEPIWRGSLSLCDENFGIVGGLVAHLSSLACSKVCEEAKLLPKLLCSELLSRTDVWPKGFKKWGPSDASIALYFFPDSERYEKSFYSLVDYMIRRDLAMRAVVENAELLLFSSNILPLQIWRFQAKFYLWGVFRGKQASHLTTVIPGEEKDLAKTSSWDLQSPVSPLSNCGSHGSGSVYPPFC